MSTYQVVAVYPQESALGQTIAINIQENSGNPWTLLGYIVEANAQEVAAT